MNGRCSIGTQATATAKQKPYIGAKPQVGMRSDRGDGGCREAWESRVGPCLPPAARMGYGSRMPSKDDLYDEAIDLFGDGKLAEAVAKYEEALALDPSFADAWHGLAVVLAEMGEHQRAIEAGKKLCALTPDDVLAHTSLSRFYQAAGMVPEAEAEGAKARMLDWKRQLQEAKDQKPG